jgi:hypothetical protein
MNDLRDAGLRDIPYSAIQEQFRNVRARNSAVCDAEYGTRGDDNALVFHFYPPGYGLDCDVMWDDWHGFRDRLEVALMKHFTIEHIDAGYAEELKSFFAIVAPRPQVPDLTALIEKFFETLEA